MATEEFLARCSTKKFEKHLSTLARDETDALREQLTAKVKRVGLADPWVIRSMEQLKATENHLVRLGSKSA